MSTPADNLPGPAALQQLLAQGAITQAQHDQVIGVLALLKSSVGAALAQGAARQAVAEQGVIVDGDNHAPIHTGNVLHLYLDTAGRPGAKPEDLRRGYFARLLLQMDRLPLPAGDAADSAIRLSAVYTALLTDYARPAPNGSRDDASELLQGLAGMREGRPPVSALEAPNAERCLLLLGEPGSGLELADGGVELLLGPGPHLGGDQQHKQVAAPDGLVVVGLLAGG